MIYINIKLVFRVCVRETLETCEILAFQGLHLHSLHIYFAYTIFVFSMYAYTAAHVSDQSLGLLQMLDLEHIPNPAVSSG